MHKTLANTISYIFHPLLFATIMVWVLFYFTPELAQPINDRNIWQVLLAIFLLTFLVPVLSIGTLVLVKSISSFKLEIREERVMPFFFIAIYYALATYFFTYKLRFSEVVVVMFMGMSAMIFLITIITIRFKISVHAVGSWGVVGFLMALHFNFPGTQLLIPTVVSIVMAGLISSARLALNTHSPREVGIGAVLGFIISFGSIFIFT